MKDNTVIMPTFDNASVYTQYDKAREDLVVLLAKEFIGNIEGFANHKLNLGNVKLIIDKNEDNDAIKALEFPNGCLYFNYIIDVDALNINHDDYKKFIGKLLEYLWYNNTPAVATCDFEDQLPKQGGYKNTDIPWPGKSLTVS